MGRNTRGADKLIMLAELYGAALLIDQHRNTPEVVAASALQYASAMMRASNAVMQDAMQRDAAESGGQIDKTDDGEVTMSDADLDDDVSRSDDGQPLQYQEQSREDLQREADAFPHASAAPVPDTERPPVDTGEASN